MSDDPIPPIPDDLDELRRENAELRQKLERSQELNRLNAQSALADHAYEPITEDEIQEMRRGPRGRSPWEMIEEFERSILDGDQT